MRHFVKFCGMRTRGDIEIAAELGVDAIGLVLVPGTPRALTLEQASELRHGIPMSMQVFVLVKDATRDEVAHINHVLNPNYVQFHGTESAGFCEQFDRPYCKALSLADPALDERLEEFLSADYVVLDGHAPGAMGGAGVIGDWSRYPQSLGERGILAGGLMPGNVALAIRSTGCFGVDVSSGIESSPAIKSPARMMEFMRQVCSVNGR